MRSVTIGEVQAWGSCEDYLRERLLALATGRERMTAAEIAALDIPVEDRLWAILHEEFIDEKELHLLACQFAKDALMRERAAGREPDLRC
jgi:hypothetical protein